jgi:hypothetical protein
MGNIRSDTRIDSRIREGAAADWGEKIGCQHGVNRLIKNWPATSGGKCGAGVEIIEMDLANIHY